MNMHVTVRPLLFTAGPSFCRRMLFGLVALAVLLGALRPSPADAQSRRAGDKFYTKLGGGLSDYAGDNDGRLGLDRTTGLQEFFNTRKFTDRDAFPYVLVGELGYQFSPELGMGLGYQFGRHPFANGVPFTTTPSAPGRGGNLGTGRHTIQLLGRYMVGATAWTFSPYIDAGLNVSLGGLSTGAGHLVGIGVDASVTDRMSLFLEGRLSFTFGDAATDGIATGTSADALSALPAVGLKYTVDRPAVPPRILALDGPAEVIAGEPAAFSARVNEEEATRPLTYEWTFGDGRSATGLAPSHVYNEPGTYTAVFTARNEAGTARDSLVVDVLLPPRIAALDATPNPAPKGEPVRFSSEVEGARPIERRWDFGDGTIGAGRSPAHTYDAPGEYTVRLLATNEDEQDRDSVTVQVERVLPALCQTVEELNSVYFAPGSSQLTDEAQQELEENAEVLRTCPNLAVRVEGFASPDEPNPQTRSDERAQAVATYYEMADIAPDRITTSGEGAVGDSGGKKGPGEQNRRADSLPQRDDR